MADSFIQVAPDSNGKLLQTYENLISGKTVEAEAVVVVDTTGTPIGTNAGALNVYLGVIQANAGTNLNTSGIAASLTNGGQKTQICDPVNVSNVAGVTNGALNVYLASLTVNSGTNLNTANVSIKQFTGAGSVAGGQVAVSNVATTIAGSRPTRRSVTIRNQDLINSGYVGPVNVNTSNGLILFPRDSISVDYIGIIQGITGGNNVTFGYLETYD